MMDSKKIDKAIRLLQTIDGEAEVAFSGGKDSCVILELTKMAGIRYEAIYKNTTIDPPGTIAFCKKMGVTIVNPKQTFFQLVEKKGFPSRRCRFCCDVLKEYKIKDISIHGIRRSESTKRAANYKEPVICRIYNGGGDNHVNVYLPILDWTDQDVLDFITDRQIELHPLYYDENGKIDVKRRLGCMCCPLKSDNGLADFERYPNMVKAYIKAGKKWWNKEREKPLKSKEKFESIYDLFAHRVFFDSYEAYKIFKYGMFGTADSKALLGNYFKIKLD